jgi:hypothetical protein
LIAALFVVWLTAAALHAAGPPGDILLPATTQAYVSIAKPSDMKARWQQTQLGRMLNDELMQPFVEDLRKQLTDKVSLVTDKLGIAWDDLDGVPAGEMSLALIKRADRPAAMAITIDVTDRKAQSDRLLAAIEKRFAARGGRKATTERSGTTFLTFTIPGTGRNAKPQETVYFLKDNILCGVDDRAEADAMLARFAGNSSDNLRSVAAYTTTMDRCRRESQSLEPELRWYADPFGFIFAARTLQKTPRNPHDKDMVKILHDQGFDAIQGAGGFVNLLAGNGVEVLHRTAIYAPPAPGKENDALRWNLSMRMMQLPNSERPEPPSWAPRMSANWSTLSIDPKAVFENMGPLVDAVKEHEGAWKTTVEAWRTDLYGPQVDVEKEFVANMGSRLTMITDYATPITVGSERSIVAIEVRNEKAVAAALEKWMKGEGPSVKRRELGEIVIWERVPPEEKANALEIPGLIVRPGAANNKPKEDTERERMLPNSASCVALGQLMMASDIEYLKEVLAGYAVRERLASCDDYQLVVDSMQRVAPGECSGWSFGRMDEEWRPTFELVRLNKMPQSKTMLGKMLNNLLTTEVEREEGIRRKQRVDGSSLPNFEAIRRYFGPAGRSLRSDRDGWVLSGVILSKEAP